MQYRRLGKTGFLVSVVGIGAWQFGGEWGKDFTQAEVNDILASGKELGINLIDTAECYGDHRSEKFIGEALKGQRQDWIIATKFGHIFHGEFDRTDDFSPEGVRRQLDDSLQALNTEYIDLYQFHSGPDEAFDTEGLWEMLNKQVEMGKIRSLGISIGSNDNLYQTERATDIGAGAIQVVYNRLDRTPEKRVFPSARKQNLGVLARVPLASGLLSGKYKPGHQFSDESDVRAHRDKEEVQQRLEEVQRIQEEEVPEGVPMATWALGWVLKHPAVTCVIPGMKSVDQVVQNARAAALEIVPTDHPQAIQ